MHHVRIFSAFAFAAVAILAAPTAGASQTTTDKIEQKVKSAAQDVKAEVADSWLTAKTKIALYSDERVKGRQISVETVKGTIMLRGKVDSDEAKTAAGSIAEGVQQCQARVHGEFMGRVVHAKTRSHADCLPHIEDSRAHDTAPFPLRRFAQRWP